MDYFDILLAKKLSGGGGGEITVEGLSVEDNGTYTAPSGKAYSPVVVNLPLDEKTITANGEYLASADDLQGYSKVTVNVAGYKVKSMPAGAISSFADGTDNPLRDLKVSIVPVQSGSGDPSPSNPRPISGWTGANIHVADGENPHVIDNVVNVSWQTEAGTVYGGELDVTRGVLTVIWKAVDLGSFNYTYGHFTYDYFKSQSAVSDFNGADLSYMCSIYATVTNTRGVNGLVSDNTFFIYPSDKYIYLRNDSYSDASAFKTAMSGIYVVYKSDSPLIYQLTPTQVSSILGTNNIWADTGDILEGEYFTSL